MAHSMQLSVIAEGVENDAQLAFLREHHCDEMQGFHLSHALPAGDLTRWIGARPVARTPDESSAQPTGGPRLH